MKYYVNEECIGCGMCEALCPEIFQLAENGLAKASDQEAEGGINASAVSAMNGCPVNAIREQQ